MSARKDGLTRACLKDLLFGFAKLDLLPDLEVEGLELDSRAVKPGDLFVALKGLNSHGLQFAPQAIGKGCAAVIFEPTGADSYLATITKSITLIPITDLQQQLGHIASRFFGHPSSKLSVIGITGTNGKTSCSHFLAECLGEDSSMSAVVGTLGWGMPGATHPTNHTTPDAVEIQEILFKLHASGFKTVIMEASSHGLDQGRLNGVAFKGALFTNFSRDHLDYHVTMEDYMEAKLLLANMPGLEFVVFNANSIIASFLRPRLDKNIKSIEFAVGDCPPASGVLLHTSGVDHELSGVSFDARFEGEALRIHAPVFGDFNVENLSATLGVLISMGYDLRDAAHLLSRIRPVPGRMESCEASDRLVIIDYAHTPDALLSILKSLKQHCKGIFWVVFGCGGDRDKGKRPEMGRIATEFADRVIVTDDNPRSEDGDSIIAEILAGCSRENPPLTIRDRKNAIHHALEHSSPGDVIVVAGKGHETTQEVNGIKYPFNDRETVLGQLHSLGLQK